MAQRVRIAYAPLQSGHRQRELNQFEDAEEQINRYLRSGWLLRDTHVIHVAGGPMLVAVLVDDEEPRRVVVVEEE